MKRFAVLTLVLSLALLLGACSKTLNVADLELEEDLSTVAETETGGTVSDVSCPEEIDDPADGAAFTCELSLEDGSTLTANLELEEADDGSFQATFQGFDE